MLFVKIIQMLKCLLVKCKFNQLNRNRALWRRPMKIVLNEKGQVSFFIALTFQILFMFFAMVVNVGLLVHHKINLQNSVDMAAYYGASKQAEVMNAIAHINYQMRQSFKLLTWRYRMIGSAGDQTYHPAIKNFSGAGVTNQLNFKNDLLNYVPDCESPVVLPPFSGFVSPTNDPSGNIAKNGFYCRGTFCSNYYPLKPTPMLESYCKNTNQFNIPLLDPSKAASLNLPLPGFEDLQQSVKDAYDNILKSCTPLGSLNFLTLSRMIISYRFDQQARSFALVGLARSMSESTDDFFDIDGQSVKKGVLETLRNNLSVPNLEGLQATVFYNSFGGDRCKNLDAEDHKSPQWLSRIKLYPSFYYTDIMCANKAVGPNTLYGNEKPGSDGLGVYNKQFFPDFKLPYHYTDIENQKLKDEIIQNGDYLQISSTDTKASMLNPAIGYEKNPWCMGYVGVSAVTTPKIPFSLGGVKMVARAFAKPFGGRIGPWYGKTWPSGENSSDGSSFDKKIDRRLTARYTGTAPMANDPTLYTNFSLFPGDKLGLANPKLYAYYGEAIYLLDPTLSGVSAAAGPDISDSPSQLDWWHLVGNRGANDRLAWNSKKQEPSPMRWLETSIVAPNVFDINYYSIEPDFYNRYYLRLLKNGYLSSYLSRNKITLAPDLGYRQNYNNKGFDLSTYSVRNQIYDVKKWTENSPIIGLKQFFSRFNVDFGFIVSDWKNLLTSWSEKDLFDFSAIDKDRFGKCSFTPPDVDGSTGLGQAKVPTTGQCVIGGSTGYHVKIVAKDFLLSKSLELGGEGIGAGPILNPPPDDDSFWFPGIK